MKHRNFRIAWSAAWGAMAVLLLIFWVRSYWQCEQLLIQIKTTTCLDVGDIPGQLHIRYSDCTLVPTCCWRYNATETDAFWKYIGQAPPWNEFRVIEDGFYVPFWFPLGSSVLFAMLPSLRWRYSLRTLLIATTLVAVGLGLIVWLAS
jgi:hypothetical protein